MVLKVGDRVDLLQAAGIFACNCVGRDDGLYTGLLVVEPRAENQAITLVAIEQPGLKVQVLAPPAGTYHRSILDYADN